jgi:hypothetical protein
LVETWMLMKFIQNLTNVCYNQIMLSDYQI